MTPQEEIEWLERFILAVIDNQSCGRIESAIDVINLKDEYIKSKEEE